VVGAEAFPAIPTKKKSPRKTERIYLFIYFVEKSSEKRETSEKRASEEKSKRDFWREAKEGAEALSLTSS
jgi:hypothetical protein